MQLYKVSKPSLYQLSLLLLCLPFSHARGCRGDPNNFLCVTDKNDCIDNHRVCDGTFDCEDRSDEWERLCNLLCTKLEIGANRTVKGFRCLLSSEFSATNATAAAPDHDNSYNNHSNKTNNIFQKLNPQNTVLNDTLSHYRDCQNFANYCDRYPHCHWKEDESYCVCRANPKCPVKSGTDWWLRILATTVGIIVLFIFCVCAALHWEKYRSAVLLRQREQRRHLQREAISQIRGNAPSNGHLNLGMTLDQSAFNERAQATGGVAAAPPPYSIAMEFPKPAPTWPESELPPPYCSEWIGSDDAPTISNPTAGNVAQTTVNTGAATTTFSNDAPVL